ncbi:hypothetical protein N7455_008799 [Penicillium solitum]|uniref:uncharacterized protein n=1 Tax=Penicillium solitum TaxID=60172 RepID=UPI0032C474CD|nr:hypothetical protein N7455_008799 [Penicillium solitum]
MSFDILHVVIGLAIALGFWNISRAIYNLFFSPLRKVPGPFLGRFSRFWELNAIRTTDLRPVVRIAPNRYSFNTPEALKAIYASTGGFAKSDWYAAAGHPDRPNILNMQDTRRHAENKRKIVGLYTMSTMVNYEGAVEKMNVVLMRKFREFAETKRLVRLPTFLQYYAFDIIGNITMDRNFDMMETEGDRTGFLQKIKVATEHQMTFGPFPFLHVILARLAALFKLNDPHVELFRFIAESVQRFRQIGSEPNENPKSEPFLAKLMDLELKEKVDLGSIFSSCGSNIIAGSDTTAITLSAAFYYVYRNPIVLKKLRGEIDAHERAGLLSNPAGFTEAQQMPYLQGIIKETLRMHPAVAQMLPREVPKNGVVLNGYHFPEKTQVGISAWALHYNPELIDSPREFRPQRWIGDDGNKPLSSALNFAFGGGSRVCLGKNISLLEMAKVIPEVVRYFDIRFEKPGQPWELDVGWFTWSSYKCCIEERETVQD